MRKAIGWGIINGKTLIYPSIRTTRYDAIRDHLREVVVGPTGFGVTDKPSRSWLKRNYPWLDVVKVSMTFSVDGDAKP